MGGLDLTLSLMVCVAVMVIFLKLLRIGTLPVACTLRDQLFGFASYLGLKGEAE